VEYALPRPAGIAFDLDGTLVDTVDARIEGWLEALDAAGMAAAREQIAPMIGMDGKRLAREVASGSGRELAVDEIEAIDRAAGEAFDRLNREPRPLPGADALLSDLGELGIPWVIATSSRAGPRLGGRARAAGAADHRRRLAGAAGQAGPGPPAPCRRAAGAGAR
jgi:phosphoglycolate phosphatase-like HAD superfamily hydrolase